MIGNNVLPTYHLVYVEEENLQRHWATLVLLVVEASNLTVPGANIGFSSYSGHGVPPLRSQHTPL
jgi:hypothetical protein